MFLLYSFVLLCTIGCGIALAFGVIAAVRHYRAVKAAKKYAKAAPRIVGVARSFQRAFAFLVHIDGFRAIGFSKVEGLSWARDAEGNPVLDFWNRITLTRGLVAYPKDPNDMQSWFAAPEPRDVYVAFLNRDGYVNSRLYLGKCLPATYSLSDPNNSIDENIQESIELVRTEFVPPFTA